MVVVVVVHAMEVAKGAASKVVNASTRERENRDSSLSLILCFNIMKYDC